MNTVQTSIEHRQGVFDDGVNICGGGLRSWKTGQSGEFIDQSPQGFHRASDRFSATVENFDRRCVWRRTTFEMPADTLG